MRIVIAAVASAVALFFFGFLWWGILMPVLRPAGVLSDEATIDQVMALPESGAYFYPDYADAEAAGTSMALVYFKKSISMETMMATGLAHMFVCCAIAAAFVARLNLPAFSSRFGYVFAMGVVIATWADFGNMIWWHYPPVWASYHFAYDLISWTLAGLIIAKIVQPDETASS